eukprot:gene37784-9109_t
MARARALFPVARGAALLCAWQMSGMVDSAALAWLPALRAAACAVCVVWGAAWGAQAAACAWGGDGRAPLVAAAAGELGPAARARARWGGVARVAWDVCDTLSDVLFLRVVLRTAYPPLVTGFAVTALSLGVGSAATYIGCWARAGAPREALLPPPLPPSATSQVALDAAEGRVPMGAARQAARVARFFDDFFSALAAVAVLACSGCAPEAEVLVKLAVALLGVLWGGQSAAAT